MKIKQISKLVFSASSVFYLAACNSGGAATPTSGSKVGSTSDGVKAISSNIGTKNWDNDVYFYPGSQVKDISTTNAYYGVALTTGQSWGGVSFRRITSYGLTSLEFTANAGRDSSTRIGALFYDNTSGIYAITTGADKVVNQSYFYFIRDIVVDDKKILGPVTIAQYQDGSRNAWAIGNKFATKGPDINSITMYTESGHDPYCFYHDRGLQSIEEWKVAMGDCHDVYSPVIGSDKVLRDNEQSIYISGDLDDGVASIKYTGKHSLPPIQPYAGTIISVLDDKKYGEYININFKAGRTNEGWVGQDFISKTEHNFAYASHSTSGSITDLTNKANLNFDTEITILGHKVKDPVVFAQYKSGSHNAWAVGNKSGKATADGHGLTLYTEAGENYKPGAFCISTYDDDAQRFGKQHEWMLSSGECIEREIAIKGTIHDNPMTITAKSKYIDANSPGVYLPVIFAPDGEEDVTVGQPHEEHIEVSKLKSLSANPNNSESEQRVYDAMAPELLNSEDIVFKAGHKGSADVATDLKYKMHNMATHFIGHRVSHNSMPGKLNFYIGGNLIINGKTTKHPFYIAQGHHGSVTGMVFGGIGAAIGVATMGYGLALGETISLAGVVILGGGGGALTLGGIDAMSHDLNAYNNTWLASEDIIDGTLHVDNQCYAMGFDGDNVLNLREKPCN